MARILRTYQFNCKQCGKKCEKSNRSGKQPNFCDTSCSQIWSYAHGRIKTASREFKIHQHGVERVHELEKLQYYTFTCEYCNANVTKRKRSPLPRFCNRKCSTQFTAVHGRKPTINAVHRKAMSERATAKLLEQPENLYSWNTIKGWYKGNFFRSSYEYHFLKWLETKQVNLQTDLKKVPTIQYEFDGRGHTYIPDFYVEKWRTLFEVKSSYACKNDPKVLAKAVAAEDFCKDKQLTYQIITEDTLPELKSDITLIKHDKCVFLLSTSKSTDDRLEHMFVEQMKFMKLLRQERNFPEFPVDVSSKPGQKLLKEVAHECMHELFESVHLLRNSKSHRISDVQDFDKEAFLEELSDTLHYLMELFILSGITSKDLYKAYMKKGTINFARILSNY